MRLVGWTVQDVLHEVAQGRAQLWPGERSAAVTLVLDLPQAKVCEVWLAGGDLEELLRIERDVTAWAREQGCAEVVIDGRKGWGRVLADRGYREASTVFSRRLSDG